MKGKVRGIGHPKLTTMSAEAAVAFCNPQNHSRVSWKDHETPHQDTSDVASFRCPGDAAVRLIHFKLINMLY